VEPSTGSATTLLPCLPRRRDVTTRGMAVRTPLFLAWTAVDASRWGKPWDKAKLLLEATTRDNNDNLLLCRAIVMDRYLPHAVLPLLLPTAVDNDNDGQVPLALAASTHFYSPERAHDVLQCLLQAFPAAAKSPRLLGIAVANGKTWEGACSCSFVPHRTPLVGAIRVVSCHRLLPRRKPVASCSRELLANSARS
jgi:hypothetical protein